MPNDQKVSEDEITDEEWKRRLGVSEFMDASEAKLLGIEADASGKYWAFVKAAEDWARLPYAAKAQVDGHSISLAVRLFWGDEKRPPVQNGELRVIGATELAEATGLRPDFSLPKHQSVYAVELPFRPDAVKLV